MLKQMMASKAAQLIAACVCPAALTVAVPDVRKAVHKATAPKAQAKPKVKQPPRAIAKPKTRVRAAPVVDEAPDIQLASASLPAPCVPQMTAFAPEELPTLASLDPLPGPSNTLLPPVNLINPGNMIAPVPEVGTWVQMLVGFGVVGGVTRAAIRRQSDKPADAEPATDAKLV